jgi:hypothetical protein
VSLLGGGKSPFHDDDGSADPRAAATLAAFGSGRGSEHAALTALAVTRLLVPIVAAPGGAPDAALGAAPGGAPGAAPGGAPGAAPGGAPGAAPGGAPEAAPGGAPEAALGASPGGGPGAGPGPGGGEHGAQMSLPTLIGRDGRPAIPAFTCMDALARWDPQARPVPAFAGQVWRAAVDSSSAVVVDVAGPVPLPVEGARLTALAEGQPVPLPHQDPDVLAAVREAAAGQPAIAGLRVAGAAGSAPADRGGDEAAEGDSDLRIEVTLAGGCDPRAGEAAARQLGGALMDRLGARLRRGITIAVAPPDGRR